MGQGRLVCGWWVMMMVEGGFRMSEVVMGIRAQNIWFSRRIWFDPGGWAEGWGGATASCPGCPVEAWVKLVLKLVSDSVSVKLAPCLVGTE